METAVQGKWSHRQMRRLKPRHLERGAIFVVDEPIIVRGGVPSTARHSTSTRPKTQKKGIGEKMAVIQNRCSSLTGVAYKATPHRSASRGNADTSQEYLDRLQAKA